MKIIKQFGIIFSLCWIATVIEGLLPIAFPASVIAMLLLLQIGRASCRERV